MDIAERDSIRDILARRPRAVAILEDLAGGEFWSYLDRSLDDLCAGRQADPGALRRRIEDLPPAREDTGDSGRLYELVDGLVADHRRYRDDDLPALARVLAESEPDDLPPGFPLEELRKEFHSFRLGLLLHMIEEEEFLFPEALRAEGGLAHPDSAAARRARPAKSRPLPLHTPEDRLTAMLDGLRRKFPADAGATPASRTLLRRLETLRRDLARHTERETGRLLPRARELERILLDRACGPDTRDQPPPRGE